MLAVDDSFSLLSVSSLVDALFLAISDLSVGVEVLCACLCLTYLIGLKSHFVLSLQFALKSWFSLSESKNRSVHI